MSKKEAGKQLFHMEWSDGNQQLGKLWAGTLMTIWGNICYILTAFPSTTQIVITREQNDGTETRRESETGPEQPPQGEMAILEGSQEQGSS